jgi:hypothetical protein
VYSVIATASLVSHRLSCPALLPPGIRPPTHKVPSATQQINQARLKGGRTIPGAARSRSAPEATWQRMGSSRERKQLAMTSLRAQAH